VPQPRRLSAAPGATFFPIAAQLSGMQLLLLLTCTTSSFSVERDDVHALDVVAKKNALVERMEGHPQAPPDPPTVGSAAPRVPADMWLDNDGLGDYAMEGYHYVDGLPITTTPTKRFRTYLKPVLSLVTQFHLGQQH